MDPKEIHRLNDSPSNAKAEKKRFEDEMGRLPIPTPDLLASKDLNTADGMWGLIKNYLAHFAVYNHLLA